MSTAARFHDSAQWRKLSAPIRLGIIFVLAAITAVTGTSIYVLWDAATNPATTLLDAYNVAASQVVHIFLLGAVAISVQIIMTVRASKVSILTCVRVYWILTAVVGCAPGSVSPRVHRLHRAHDCAGDPRLGSVGHVRD